MRLSDPSDEPDGECNDVFLAVSEGILQTDQPAFQRRAIAKKVRLPG